MALWASCSVSSLDRKVIIGTWKKEKTEYLPVKEISEKKTEGKEVNTISANIDPNEASGLDKESLNLLEFKKSIEQAEPRSQMLITSAYKPLMIFREDTTVTLTFLKDTINGVWKINGKGDKIIVKDKTNFKITLNIEKVNSEDLIISEKFPDGILQVQYKKQK